MMRRLAGAALVAVVVAGCAVRVGGSKPLNYHVLAVDAPSGASAAQVAEAIQHANAQLVLVSARADSTWFADVARRSNLTLSGPGSSGAVRLGFLAGKPVGDTTLARKLPGGAITIQDALYQPEKERYVDLMLVRADSGSARDIAHALLTYVASDVMQNASLVLGLAGPNPVVLDSVSSIVRPAFSDVRDCRQGATDIGPSPLRVLYGPVSQVQCDAVRRLEGPGTPLYAQIVVGRP
ncbi:MAG TPA: hypothetical protein VFQ38_09570 [Longimicrobiales bacterium]|nr:hypothetical protein [Longimicrobiales bacterium]